MHSVYVFDTQVHTKKQNFQCDLHVFTTQYIMGVYNLTSMYSDVFKVHLSNRVFALQLVHIVWKSSKMYHLSFSILEFSTNFCPIKIDLFGNTV